MRRHDVETVGGGQHCGIYKDREDAGDDACANAGAGAMSYRHAEWVLRGGVYGRAPEKGTPP
ncbi:hypothetical protein [Pararobbsia alpina]|uniref:hypothetical protein n=1 Tax=Pararobbsia alpina TaxID=621374 RepID=UPI001FE3582B|nr:hypothetical protein [Pararobbsia alpina]